ncbi:MAG: aminotransferase class IV, partial [Phycisphaerae bacterium]
PIARGEESEAAGHDGVVGDAETSGRGRAVMPSPVLPGITRRWALDWCAANDVEVVKRMVAIDDVLNADEVLLTNSSWGVLPVVRVESHGIGAGEPGTLGGELVQAWRERTGLDD